MRTMCIFMAVTMGSLMTVIFWGGLVDEANGHYKLTDKQRETNIQALIVWFGASAILIIGSYVIDNIKVRLQ